MRQYDRERLKQRNGRQSIEEAIRNEPEGWRALTPFEIDSLDIVRHELIDGVRSEMDTKQRLEDGS